MTGTVVGDGQLQGLAHRRVQVAERLGDGLSGNSKVGGADAVEALGGVAQSGRASGADVLDQGGHRGLGGGHIEGGPGKGLRQAAGGETGAAQISAGEHALKPTGRARGCLGARVSARLNVVPASDAQGRPGRAALSQAAPAPLVASEAHRDLRTARAAPTRLVRLASVSA